jgi:hypothetical protein
MLKITDHDCTTVPAGLMINMFLILCQYKHKNLWYSLEWNGNNKHMVADVGK